MAAAAAHALRTPSELMSLPTELLQDIFLRILLLSDQISLAVSFMRARDSRIITLLLKGDNHGKQGDYSKLLRNPSYIKTLFDSYEFDGEPATPSGLSPVEGGPMFRRLGKMARRAKNHTEKKALDKQHLDMIVKYRFDAIHKSPIARNATDKPTEAVKNELGIAEDDHSTYAELIGAAAFDPHLRERLVVAQKSAEAMRYDKTNKIWRVFVIMARLLCTDKVLSTTCRVCGLNNAIAVPGATLPHCIVCLPRHADQNMIGYATLRQYHIVIALSPSLRPPWLKPVFTIAGTGYMFVSKMDADNLASQYHGGSLEWVKEALSTGKITEPQLRDNATRYSDAALVAHEVVRQYRGRDLRLHPHERPSNMDDLAQFGLSASMMQEVTATLIIDVTSLDFWTDIIEFVRQDRDKNSLMPDYRTMKQIWIDQMVSAYWLCILDRDYGWLHSLDRDRPDYSSSYAETLQLVAEAESLCLSIHGCIQSDLRHLSEQQREHNLGCYLVYSAAILVYLHRYDKEIMQASIDLIALVTNTTAASTLNTREGRFSAFRDFALAYFRSRHPLDHINMLTDINQVHDMLAIKLAAEFNAAFDSNTGFHVALGRWVATKNIYFVFSAHRDDGNWCWPIALAVALNRYRIGTFRVGQYMPDHFQQWGCIAWREKVYGDVANDLFW